MTTQKGFSPLIVIIITTTLLIGAGGFLYYRQLSQQIPSTQVAPGLASDQIQPAPTEKPEQQVEELERQIKEKQAEKTPVPRPADKPAVAVSPAVTQNPCLRSFSPEFSSGPHYNGPLFDAHFHMPILIDYTKVEAGQGGHNFNSVTDPILDKDVLLKNILCVFSRENVKGAIGFSIGSEEFLDQTLNAAKSAKERAAGKLNLFLMPIGFSAAGLENIEATNKGIFNGYGEIAMYFGEQKGTSPDSQKYLDIYNVAAKNNLIVMIHPDARQENQLENVFKLYPNVRFFLHGPETENTIHDLIGKYPNVYYSIDTMLIRLPSAPGALMYMVGGKDEFKVKFVQNYEVMLNNSLYRWKSKIEQYPDRYMWGTDRAYNWTYDEEVSVLLEEFARAFIGKLDSAVQEKFAHKNAEKLLQE